ncbi:hypothetical protein U1Q18_012792 [Sarracenia purpurea var. burkii]
MGGLLLAWAAASFLGWICIRLVQVQCSQLQVQCQVQCSQAELFAAINPWTASTEAVIKPFVCCYQSLAAINHVMCCDQSLRSHRLLRKLLERYGLFAAACCGLFSGVLLVFS